MFVYVLKLQNKKYYVGKTHNLNSRLKQHFNGKGSQWTIKHKPITIEKVIPNCNNPDESNTTLEFMKICGIDNVRGGAFCNIKLEASEKNTIQKMIDSEDDVCYKCKRRGHFAKDCKKNKTNVIKKTIKKIDKKPCERCMKNGHSVKQCFAKTTINGIEIEEDYIVESDYEEEWCCKYCKKSFQTKKGATYHENIHCKKKPIVRNGKRYSPYFQ
jgi:hypothetical protein